MASSSEVSFVPGRPRGPRVSAWTQAAGRHALSWETAGETGDRASSASEPAPPESSVRPKGGTIPGCCAPASPARVASATPPHRRTGLGPAPNGAGRITQRDYQDGGSGARSDFKSPGRPPGRPRTAPGPTAVRHRVTRSRPRRDFPWCRSIVTDICGDESNMPYQIFLARGADGGFPPAGHPPLAALRRQPRSAR